MKNRTEIRQINNLVIPMLFIQILHLVFQMGDQAIVGRLGVAEFAAVGISSNFIYLITGTIGILSGAFGIIGGRFFGQGNIEKFGKSFNTSITLSIGIGVLCEILLLISGKFILQHVYDMDITILNPVCNYLYISGIGIGMNMILFIFSSYFKNIKKAKLLVTSFAVAGVINFFFDYVLVFGKLGFPKMGMSGAATGSIAGFTGSILVCMYYFRKNKLFNFSFHVDKSIARQLIKLYFPLAAQDLIEYTLFAMGIMVIIARLSTELIGAYTVLTTLIEIIMIPIYGFSGSCMTLTAQAYGKEKKDFARFSHLSSILLIMISVPITLLVIFFSYPLTRLITDKESIIQIVQHVLPLALGFNLINGLQIIIRSTLQAIDSEKWVLVYSGIIYAISLSFIYGFVAKYELPGIYVGFGLCYILLLIGYGIKLNKRVTILAGPEMITHVNHLK